jgi:hypothetical protein
MPTQTLTITMSDDTQRRLKDAGNSFYVFRPVASSNKTGVPLVWARLDPKSYFSNIPVAFETDAFCAYGSTDAIAIDHPVGIGTSIAVSRGDIVRTDADGNFTTKTVAPPDYIYIASGATTGYRCGLAAKFDNRAVQPFCAFELYAQGLVTMKPVRAIFVMWAPSAYDPGVYMRQSLGPGLFVNFDDAMTRAVTYDITQSWQCSSAAWAQTVAVTADLTQTLILDPGSNHPYR